MITDSRRVHWRNYSALFATLICLSSADADLMFGGGGGTPLSVTLDAPIVFTSTADFTGGSSSYGILFSGVYTSLTSSGFHQKTGDIEVVGSQTGMWAEGGGAMGNTFGAAGFNDLVIFMSGPNAGSNDWTINDTLTVTAGTLTTDTNFTPIPDASGPFTVQIVQGNNGFIVSEFGSQSVSLVPEPSAALLLLLAGGCSLFRRRRA